MTKGKPWSLDLEDEKKLKDWVNSCVSVDALVFSFGGQYTKNAILKKAEWLGLEVVVLMKKNSSSTTCLELPDELLEEDEAKGECVSHN